MYVFHFGVFEFLSFVPIFDLLRVSNVFLPSLNSRFGVLRSLERLGNTKKSPLTSFRCRIIIPIWYICLLRSDLRGLCIVYLPRVSLVWLLVFWSKGLFCFDQWNKFPTILESWVDILCVLRIVLSFLFIWMILRLFTESPLQVPLFQLFFFWNYIVCITFIIFSNWRICT